MGLTPKIFKPDDFEELAGRCENVAAHANNLFAAWLEQQQVVYGFADKAGWYRPDTMSNRHATHRGFLVAVEVFTPKCERHEPARHQDSHLDMISGGQMICKHCGVKLKAVWSANE